jgi:hypothetical protein
MSGRRAQERRVAQCFSVGQILHAVGVTVEGGAFPTPAQEASAYKKALRSFHPDRLQARRAAGGDIAAVIEAEEIFKLLQSTCLPKLAANGLM